MGTSVSYAGPNWPATNDAVNAATQGGVIGTKNAITGAVAAFAKDYIKASLSSGYIVSQGSGRGTSSGGGGRTSGGGSRVATAGVGLASFVSTVRSSGLESALKGIDLGHVVGKSVEDICDAITDALAGQDGLLDDASIREAMSRTLEEMCAEVKTAQELELLLQNNAIPLNVIVMKFYCNALQVNFENKEWNKVQQRLDSADKARDFFERSKEYIQGFVEYKLSKEVDLMKYDLSGPNAISMAESLNREVMEALGNDE